MYNSVAASTFAVLCPIPELIHPPKQQLCTHLIVLPHPPLTSAPAHHLSTSYLYEFNYSEDLVWLETYSICHFVSGLFHLPCFEGSFHVVACVRISFLLLNHIPLYRCGYVSVCTKLFLSWSTLCNRVDCSPSGSSVHGILQAKILEWVAMPSSRGS